MWEVVFEHEKPLSEAAHVTLLLYTKEGLGNGCMDTKNEHFSLVVFEMIWCC